MTEVGHREVLSAKQCYCFGKRRYTQADTERKRLKVHSASVLQTVSPQEHKGAEDLAAEDSRERKTRGKKGRDREHNWMMRKKRLVFNKSLLWGMFSSSLTGDTVILYE